MRVMREPMASKPTVGRYEYDTRTQSLVTKEDSNGPIVGRAGGKAGGKAQMWILKVQGKEEANRNLNPSGMESKPAISSQHQE